MNAEKLGKALGTGLVIVVAAFLLYLIVLLAIFATMKVFG